MRFLLDENIHQGLIPVLAGLGHDVCVCPKGIANGEVLRLAASEKRILLTHDTDFSKKPLTTGHPGVVLVRIPPRHFDRLKTAIKELIQARPSHDRFAGMLFILWEDKVEVSPFSLS